MTELDTAPDTGIDEELERVLASPPNLGEPHDAEGGDGAESAVAADIGGATVGAAGTEKDGGTAEGAEKAAGGEAEKAENGKRNPRSVARSTRRYLSHNGSSIATWTGGALCAIAVFCLLFVGYVEGFSRVEMSRAQTHLIAALNGTGGYASLTGVVPADGAPAAVLTIPSLGLNDVVVAGTSAQDLEQGPGYLLGSAPPGTRGNTVIAGKRTSYGGPFGNIASLRPGDQIVVVSSLGTFKYKVEQAGTVLPGWRDPAGPVDRAQLTLVTADSGLFPTGLEYVVAGLVGKPVAYVSSHAIVPPSGSFGLNGDGGLIWPTLLWFLLLGCVGVGTVIAVRRCRKPVIVYVIAAPIVLAVCMVVFHDLSGLLPATF
jgi:sortase A